MNLFRCTCIYICLSKTRDKNKTNRLNRFKEKKTQENSTNSSGCDRLDPIAQPWLVVYLCIITKVKCSSHVSIEMISDEMQWMRFVSTSSMLGNKCDHPSQILHAPASFILKCVYFLNSIELYQTKINVCVCVVQLTIVSWKMSDSIENFRYKFYM